MSNLYLNVTAPPGAGTISNEASVASDTPDPNPANNMATTTTTVIAPAPDVAVYAVDAPDPVVLGGSLDYYAQAFNNGPVAATNVVVTDTLPAGTTFVSATAAYGSGTCAQSSGVVTCTFPSIAAYAYAYIFIRVRAPSVAGTISNTIAASLATDSDPTNNTTTVTTAVSVASADLSVSMPGAPTSVGGGDTLTYPVHVENRGPTAAENVVATDTLPAGTVFVSASVSSGPSSCTQSTGTVTCTIASIPSGGSADLAVKATAPVVAGTINNQASVASDAADPNSANNVVSASTVVGATDLYGSVSTSSPAITGQFLTYYAYVYNYGPSTANNVVLTDTLPAGVTFVSATMTAGGGSCAQAAGVVTCTIPSILRYNSASLALTATAPGTTGTITDTLSITSDTPDLNPANNTASVTTNIKAPYADLYVYWRNAPTQVAPGAPTVYQVTAVNEGPLTATNVVLTDTLPAGVSFVSASVTHGAGSCNQSAGVVTCTIPTIDTANYTDYVDLSIAVNAPPVAGTMTNLVSVTADTADAVLTNNAATASTTVRASAADLGAYLSAPTFIATGESFNYLAYVYNGATTATNVVVTETLPTGVTYVGASVTYGSGSCAEAAGVVTCTIPSIAAYSYAYVTVTATAPGVTGSITNALSVSSELPDSNPVNNSATFSSTVVQPAAADLNVSQYVSSNSYYTNSALTNSSLTYQLQVDNYGPTAATNVVTTDTLPGGVAFVSASMTSGGGSCSQSAGVVTCTVPTIAAYARASVTVTVTTPAVEGTVANAISVSSDTPDPNPANNTAATSTLIVAPTVADLSASVTGPAQIAPGASTEYQIQVSNFGPASAANATMIDTLPAGATFVSATFSYGGGSCSEASDVVTCTTASIPANGTAYITVTVTAPTVPGAANDAVSVTSDAPDSNPTNNTAVESTIVATLGRSDLAVYAGGPSYPVASGSLIHYEADVYDYGPATVTNAVLTDTLPVGATFVSAQLFSDTNAVPLGECSQSGRIVTCPISSLTPYSCGDNGCYGVTYLDLAVTAPNAIGLITNSAHIDSDAVIETDRTNNTSSTTTSVRTPPASLDLSVSASGPSSDPSHPIATGTSIDYATQATNNGPIADANVVITDTLPPGATFVSATFLYGGDGSCSQSAGVVTCTIPSLDAYSSSYVTITATAPNVPGTISNFVSVTSDAPDPNPANNTATVATTLVAPSADLSVNAYSSPRSVERSGSLTYGLQIYNNGPTAATNVVITDTLPAGTTFVSASALSGSATCSQLAGVVTCSIPSIGTYQNEYLFVTVTAPTTAGTIKNVATVTADTPDPNTTQNTATTPTTVFGDVVDLVLSVSQPRAQPVGGELHSFVVSVANDGPATARAVSITDIVPIQFAVIAASLDSRCSVAGPTVTCSLGDIAAAASPITITIPVMPVAAGAYSNAVTVSSSTPEVSPDPNPNTVQTAGTAVDGKVDLEATQTTAPSPGVVSKPLDFTLGVKNHGPAIAHNVVLDDTVPSEFSTITIASPATSGSCLATGRSVHCQFGDVASGASASVVIETVPSVASARDGSGNLTPFLNSVVVGSDNAEVTPQQYANTDQLGFYVVADQIDLVAGITTKPHGTLGVPQAYTLSATNQWYGTATNVVMTDTIPSQFTIDPTTPFSGVSAGGSCQATANAITCTFSTVGPSQTVQAVVNLLPNTVGAAITDTLHVSTADETDLDLTNNDLSITTKVSNAPTAQLIINPTSTIVGQDITATVNAADIDSDALTYTLYWGDGTSANGNYATGLTLHHTYANRGPFSALLLVTDGGAITQDAQVMQVDPDQPVVANAGPDLSTTANVRVLHGVTLDGSVSTPECCISTYHWHLSDGRDFTGATIPDVRFATPGVYTATLTVTSGPDSRTDTAQITVGPEAHVGANITVLDDATGTPIQGADVTIAGGDGGKYEDHTGIDGIAELIGLPNGTYTAFVVQSGYHPNQGPVTISAGAGSATVRLTAGELAVASLTAAPITDPQQLTAAGIDTTDPKNNNVFKFDTHLTFESQPINFTGYVAAGNGFVGNPDPGGISCDQAKQIAIQGLIAGEDWSYLCVLVVTPDYVVTAIPRYVDDTPTIVYMVVPGNAKWLKEFYDVQMTVSNLGSPGFVLSNGVAQLKLPIASNGSSPLGLPALSGNAQQLVQPMADIPGGQSGVAKWIVRGDQEGLWNLSATYSGVLEPNGTPVQLAAATDQPIHVWGGSALRMTIDVDSRASAEYPYHARIEVKNVADVPVYNFSVQLADSLDTTFILQPQERPTRSTPEIDPNQTWTSDDYILVPTISGPLELANSFVAKLGGNAAVPTTVATHDPVESPATAPTFSAESVVNTLNLKWDAVPGATQYRLFTTTSPTTPFEAAPLATFDATTTNAQLRNIPAADTLWYGLSAVVDGTPTMFHPLTQGVHVNVKVIIDHTPWSGTAPFAAHLTAATVPDVDPADIVSTSWTFDDGPATSGFTADHTFGQHGWHQVTFTLDLADGSAASDSISIAVKSANPTYYAMGDSFSSGTGAPDQLPLGGDWVVNAGYDQSPYNTNDPNYFTVAGGDGCLRSENAYSRQLWEKRPLPYLTLTDIQHVACNGAVTDQLYTGMNKEPSQIFGDVNHTNNWGLDGNQRLITMTMGGNDAFFAPVVQDCVLAEFHIGFRCEDKWSQTVDAAIQAMSAQSSGVIEVDSPGGGTRKLIHPLQQVYATILNKAEPGARLIVLGYPRFFTPNALNVDSSCLENLYPSDAAWLNRVADELDDAIRIAAQKVGAEYIDVRGVFAGHEIGSGYTSNGTSFNCKGVPGYTQWINGVSVKAIEYIGGSTVMFHPPAAAYGAEAQLIYDYLATHPEINGQIVDTTRFTTSSALVNVSSGQQQATVTSSWPGSDIRMSLTSPSGRTIGRDTTDPDVAHVLRYGFESYTIDKPEPGAWTVNLYGADVAPTGEQARVSLFQEPLVDRPPTGTFTSTPPSATNAPTTVTLDATSSFDSDGHVVAYSWDLGDGSIAAGAVVNHTYTRTGTFPVALTVTDDSGLTDTYTKSIGISAAPVAVAHSFATAPGEDLVLSQSDLLAGATDPDDTSGLRASWASIPANGDLHIETDGAIRYTPNAGFVGDDSFQYLVVDPHGLLSSPALVTIHVALSRAAQFISFGPLTDMIFGDAPFGVSAVATSDLSTSFSSDTPGVCSVANATVSIVAAGQCTIRALQSGDASWLPAADVVQSFTVSRAPIAVVVMGSQTYDGTPTFTASYTVPRGTTISGAVTCTGLSGSEPIAPSLQAAGSYTIDGATCSGLTESDATNFVFVYVGGKLTVNRKTPAGPTITNIPGSAIAGNSFLPIVGTDGDGAKSVSSSTPSICSLSNGTVNFAGIGQCTLTAHVAQGTNYLARDGLPQTFSVLSPYSFLGFLSPLPKAGAVSSSSTIPVKFRIGNPDGSALTDAAAALARTNVTISASADGSNPLTIVACAYESTAHEFQCNVKPPKGVKKGVTYYVTANVLVGSTSAKIPAGAAASTPNPGTVTFK